jgi:anaerobic magnesium-protoporphyrin IX monomethyl ester cyclase
MDILLTHGYFIANDPHEQQIMKPYPPLGLLYISAYLKQQGFTVGVQDNTFAQWEDFTSTIAQEQPPVIGIYTNMMTKRTVLRMVQYVAQYNCTIVLGGPDPAYYAQEYIQHGAHIIARGEGEHTLAELLPHLAQHGRNNLDGILGIVWQTDDGQIVENDPRPMIADLSQQPWPDREAIHLEQYLDTWRAHHGYSMTSIIHARGCPYTCTWCSHSVFGNTHRRRSPDDAADELLWIYERYQPDRIWYADDVFTINYRWLFAYAEALKERGLKIPFECISRADRLNQEVIDTLADMGCWRLWNGSESGSQPVLDAMKRKVDVADVQAKTHMLQKAGIEAGMFIMLGYHGETIQDIENTVEHLKISNPDIFLTTVAYPIKGTPYYAEVEADILAQDDWQNTADRDLTVAGRYSKRFYNFATRYMVNAVNLHQAEAKQVPMRRQAKMWLNKNIGRWGMRLTAHEREQEGQRLAIVREQT